MQLRSGIAHFLRPSRVRRQMPRCRVSHPAAVVLIAALLGLSVARAAPRCGTEHDQSVFELEALKSELMVLATTCHDHDRYNAFVQKYQPQLENMEHEFDSYFNRLYGKKGQRARDTYATALSNSQASAAQALGTDFCPRDSALFAEVMALRAPAELPAYAAGKDLIPASLGACETAPPPAPKAGSRATRVRRAPAR
jgi:hypothetical protein